MEQLFRPASAPTDRLVLYFNGWALSPIAVEHLGLPEGQDLLLLWDYRTDALDFDFSPYREIRLVAWSMGIWAADRFFAKHEELRSRVVSGTALAGTGYQVDDAVGIPEAFFHKTLEGLTEENRERFDRHMLGGKTYRHLYEEVRQRIPKLVQVRFGQVEHTRRRFESGEVHIKFSHTPIDGEHGLKNAVATGKSLVFHADKRLGGVNGNTLRVL